MFAVGLVLALVASQDRSRPQKPVMRDIAVRGIQIGHAYIAVIQSEKSVTMEVFECS